MDGFSCDGDGVSDGLPHGLTDESDDVQMERNFPTKRLLKNSYSNTCGFFHHEVS